MELLNWWLDILDNKFSSLRFCLGLSMFNVYVMSKLYDDKVWVKFCYLRLLYKLPCMLWQKLLNVLNFHVQTYNFCFISFNVEKFEKFNFFLTNDS